MTVNGSISGSEPEDIDRLPTAAALPEDKANRRIQLVVVSVLICAVFLFLGLASTIESFSNPQDVVLRKVKILRNDDDDVTCLSLCNERRVQRSKHFFGLNGGAEVTEPNDPSRTESLQTSTVKDFIDADRKELVKLIKNAKKRLLSRLRIDYGDKYFEDMFVDGDTYRPFYPVTPEGDSWNRIKRKLMVKLLSAQVTSKQQETNVNGLCDCTSNKSLKRGINITAEAAAVETVFERYVWATGGHSAAAAHGNMFNESYTAFMERDLVDVFGSVGIEFVGRNYAMGGTGSAAEIAMCWEEVFGSDVDIFSWDYGMTDGNDPNKLFFYGYRGGLSPGQPAIVGIHLAGRSRGGREGSLKALERLGMASFYGKEDAMAKQRDGIPDMAGLSDTQIATLPEYVRSFKCSGQIEKGDPSCGSDKYTEYACKRRGGRAGWHPGFKDHAMIGHGLSLLMVEALLEAAEDLASHETEDPEELLNVLRQDDVSQFEKFQSADIEEKYLNLFHAADDIQAGFNGTAFYKGRSFCHTARTPSRSRYLGHVTNTDQIGGPAPFGQETYFVGIEDSEARKNPTMDGTMRLVWTKNKEREDCDLVLKPDYKDFFMTTDKDGWTKLVMPNEAERKAYRYNPADIEGVVVFILKGCDWGKCEKGYLNWNDFEEKKWEMKINGKSVVSIHDIGHGALLVKGKDGIYFPPNDDGLFEIQINVKEKDSFVKVSSFVIY